MCGINGITWRDEELILRMNGAIRHRGPDGTGRFVDDHVSLGHNLLAITDTPANSAQPVVSSDGRYVLVYNGEIYNYRALRDDLRREGDEFITDADTEMLFAGLVRHGSAFLEQLDGMYAIAFYDARAGTLLMARDPAGIKPLYWSVGSRGLVFSSELRGLFAAGIPRTLDATAAELYLALGYVPGPGTLVAGVCKLCPGQYLQYRLDGCTVTTGWTGRWRDRDLPDVTGDINAVIRQTVGASARSQTMGLRPFGLYLSGGLDSGIILHEMTSGSGPKFKTYTTRFEVPAGLARDFNEDADVARRLCGDYGVEHRELVVRADEYAEAYEAAVQAIEEPRWNPGIGAYWLLAREAAKDIVVVLNGSGGDELFFGYPKYLESRRISERYARYPRIFVDLWYTASALHKGRVPIGRLLHLSEPLQRWAYLNRISDRGAFAAIVDALQSVDYPALRRPLADAENAVAELDRLFWLADEEYIRTDKISMHFGMEGRFPLMGRDVVRLANATPSEVKLRVGTTKHLLRQAYRGHLPDYVVNKAKTGWKAPVGHWMGGPFGELVRQALSAEYYGGLEGFIDPGAVRTRFVDGVGHFSTRTMKNFLPVVALQIWARHFNITG